jgi:hypothetical protein
VAGVGAALEQGRLPSKALFSELWLDALARFGIPSAIDDPTLLEPPRPSSHPSLASLEPLSELPARALRIKQPGRLHFIADDQLLIVAEQAAAPGRPDVHRTELERSPERHTHLLLDPGAPTRLAVHAGPEKTALIDLEGATQLEMPGRIWSAFVASDGSISAHAAGELARRDPHGNILRRTLAAPQAPGWMRFAGSHFLVREPNGRLTARALGPRGLESRLELGTTSISSPTLELCRTASHVFVLLRERNLHAPTQLVVLGQSEHRLFELPALRQRLSCAGQYAVTLALERSGGLLRVVETTCSAGGCSTEHGAVHPELAIVPELGDELLADAVRIGQRIAVAWRARQAVKVKVATPDALSRTAAQVVAEDPASGEADPVHRFRLDSFGESAMLLLDSARGSFGFVVTPLGVMPLAAD